MQRELYPYLPRPCNLAVICALDDCASGDEGYRRERLRGDEGGVNEDSVKRRATVHDVARAAGVSLATVDRVLNGRPGVRAITAEKVA